MMFEHEITLSELCSTNSPFSNMLDKGVKNKDYYKRMVDQYVGDFNYKNSCVYHDIKKKYDVLTKKDLITLALFVERLSGVKFMKFMERNLGAIYKYLDENEASRYFSIIGIKHYD